MKTKIGLFPACRPMSSRSPSGYAVLWLAIAAASCCGPFAEADQNKKELHPSETPEVTLSKEDTLESLSAALKGDREVRIVAIRKLGMIDAKESRALLAEHYRALPQASPSTGAKQPEKVLVVRELVKKMEQSEKAPFLFNVLDEEMKGMREAKKIEQENYYPKDLTRTVLSLLEEQGVTPDIRSKFAEYTRDQTLPTDMRADLLARTMLVDMEERGVRNNVDKVRIVVDEIAPRPVGPIPWHIYTNQLARMNYGKTEAVQA